MNAAQTSTVVQSKIRRNAEEQNDALYSLVSWGEKMKEIEEKRTRKPMAIYQGDGTRRDDDCPLHPTAEVAQCPSLVTSETHSTLTLCCTEEKRDEIRCERLEGNALYATGKYKEAIVAYSRYISENPDSAIVFSNRAMTYIKLKDWKKAEDDASAAIQINKLHVKSYQRRAVARSSLGKLRAALGDARFAMSMTQQQQPIDKIGQQICQLENLLRCAIKLAPRRSLEIVYKLSEENQEIRNDVVDYTKHNPTCYETQDNLNNDTTKEYVSTERAKCDKNNIPPLLDIKFQAQSTPIPLQYTTTFKRCHEFERYWKKLERTVKSDFLSKIQPHYIGVLYRNGMEDSDIFLDLINASVCLDNGTEFVDIISKISSIDIVGMMMTKEERAQAKEWIVEIFKRCGKMEKSEKVLEKMGL